MDDDRRCGSGKHLPHLGWRRHLDPAGERADVRVAGHLRRPRGRLDHHPGRRRVVHTRRRRHVPQVVRTAVRRGRRKRDLAAGEQRFGLRRRHRRCGVQDLPCAHRQRRLHGHRRGAPHGGGPRCFVLDGGSGQQRMVRLQRPCRHRLGTPRGRHRRPLLEAAGQRPGWPDEHHDVGRRWPDVRLRADRRVDGGGAPERGVRLRRRRSGFLPPDHRSRFGVQPDRLARGRPRHRAGDRRGWRRNRDRPVSRQGDDVDHGVALCGAPPGSVRLGTDDDRPRRATGSIRARRAAQRRRRCDLETDRHAELTALHEREPRQVRPDRRDDVRGREPRLGTRSPQQPGEGSAAAHRRRCDVVGARARRRRLRRGVRQPARRMDVG